MFKRYKHCGLTSQYNNKTLNIVYRFTFSKEMSLFLFQKATMIVQQKAVLM